MDYEKNYYDIINSIIKKKRKKIPNDNLNLHHILPKCLFPKCKDCPFNLIAVSDKEHFLLHYLLFKFTQTESMRIAFWNMSNISGRKIGARQYSELRKNYIANMQGGKNPFASKIICLDDFKRFDSIIDASNYYNIGSISAVCNHKQNSTHGLHFMFLEEFENSSKETMEKYLHPVTKKRENIENRIEVYCLELDMTFPSCKEAERFVGIASENKISSCIRGIRKSAGKHPATGEKLHWKRKEKLSL